MPGSKVPRGCWPQMATDSHNPVSHSVMHHGVAHVQMYRPIRVRSTCLSIRSCQKSGLSSSSLLQSRLSALSAGSVYGCRGARGKG